MNESHAHLRSPYLKRMCLRNLTTIELWSLFNALEIWPVVDKCQV